MTPSSLSSARASVRFSLLLPTLCAVACGTRGPTDPEGGVATVQVDGAARIKVGDLYQFTAKARLDDGTVVQRPIAWGVVHAHKGAIDPTGRLMASQGGSNTITATVEGVTGTAPIIGYDWQQVDDGSVVLLRLAGDSAIVNRHNAGAYPELVVGCSAGIFFVAVVAAHVTPAHGNVSYAFDNSAPVNDNWIASEAGGFLFPGTTNASHKQFANAMASSGTFRIAFVEAQGGPQLATFRVSGLTQRLPAVTQGCPQ